MTRVAIKANGGDGLFKVYPDVATMVTCLYGEGEVKKSENKKKKKKATKQEKDVLINDNEKEKTSKSGGEADKTQFHPWQFRQVASGFWQKISNRKKYIAWLKVTVGARSVNDLKVKHFKENHGKRLLDLYNGSPSEVIRSLTGKTEATTDPLVPTREKGHWDKLENQRQFAEKLKSVLKYSEEKDWYGISRSAFVSNGGGGLLDSLYEGSPYLFLKAVYPEVSWEPWRFRKLPSSSLDDPVVMAKVLFYVKSVLKMKSEEEWRRLTVAQLRELGVAKFFEHHGGVQQTMAKFSKWADRQS